MSGAFENEAKTYMRFLEQGKSILCEFNSIFAKITLEENQSMSQYIKFAFAYL